jgi:glycopeptide antibiotics resistance protein
MTDNQTIDLWTSLLSYSDSLIRDIPGYIYEGLTSIFCIVLVNSVAWKGCKTGLRFSLALLLIEYIILLYCSTVFYRAVLETRQYDLRPFWSYVAIQDGRVELLPENIMNVLVFIPVGLLLNVAPKQMTWWKAVLIGCGISVTIETLQFFFMRGFSEVDDVVHNTLGTLIGFGILSFFRIIFKIRYKNVRKKENLSVLSSHERGRNGTEVR